MEKNKDLLYGKIEKLVQYLGHLDQLKSSCCTLSMVQTSVIMAIGSMDSLSIVALADHLRLDKSTVSRHVSNLFDEGYLTRTESPEDRRYFVLGLTSKGEKAYQLIQSVTQAYYLDVFAKMSPEDQEHLHLGLSALLGVLDSKAQ